MNDTSAKSTAQSIAQAVQNVAGVATDRAAKPVPISVWPALLARQDKEGRELLRQFDQERGEAIVAEQAHVLEVCGRICQQFGRLELFELVYLATNEELEPKVGDGVRWLNDRTG